MTPLAIALLLAAFPPEPPPLVEAPPAAVPPAGVEAAPATPGPSCWPGLGASGALIGGVAVPAATITALSLILAQMYAGAMAGTCIGVAPALTALCGFTGIGAAVLCAGPAIPTAVGATTAYIAQAEGRSPTPALIGALPGIACGWIGMIIGCAAFPIGTCFTLPNGVITAAIAVPFLLAAGPCAACGATTAELVVASYTSLTAAPPQAVESAPAPVIAAAMAY